MIKIYNKCLYSHPVIQRGHGYYNYNSDNRFTNYNKLFNFDIIKGIKTESKPNKTGKGVDKSTQSDQPIKVKSGKVSRFRRSKISGRNLRRHPFSQDKVNPTLGRRNSGFQPSRIDDIGPRQVVLRASLKDLYGVHTSSATRSPIARPYNKWKRGRKNIDRSVAVLLHRSGLVNSIEQARQLVYHGHVYRRIKNLASTSSKSGQNIGNTSNTGIDKVMLVQRPTYVVPVGSLIFIDKVMSNLAKSNTIQWSKWNMGAANLHSGSNKTGSDSSENIDNINRVNYPNLKKDSTSILDSSSEIKRNIPSYLEVDYINGSFVLVNDTHVNTVLLPAGLGVTMKTILH